MKKVIIIFCLVILMRPLMPLIEYAANYDYISKVLCTNKLRPELKCNGKCYLMKQLAKSSENEKPDSRDKRSALWEFVWFQKTKLELLQLNLTPHKNTAAYRCGLHPIDGKPVVFKPPIFLT